MRPGMVVQPRPALPATYRAERRRILDARDRGDITWMEAQRRIAALRAAAAHRSGLDRHLVRRTVRALARKGFVTLLRGLWTEDGEPAGSGYGITQAGAAFLNARIDAAFAAKATVERSPTPSDGDG